jgi:putative transferase (TIGR04331 family)
MAYLSDRIIAVMKGKLNDYHNVDFSFEQWKLIYGISLWHCLFSLYNCFCKINNISKDSVAYTAYEENACIRTSESVQSNQLIEDARFYADVYRGVCDFFGIRVVYSKKTLSCVLLQKCISHLTVPRLRKSIPTKLKRKLFYKKNDVNGSPMPKIRDFNECDNYIIWGRFDEKVSNDISANKNVQNISLNNPYFSLVQHSMTENMSAEINSVDFLLEQFEPLNEFEEFIKTFLPKLIPIDLVEAFKSLYDFAKDFVDDKKVKRVISSSHVGAGTLPSIIGALLMEKGTEIYDVQHSAGYGLMKGFRFGEKYLFQKFLSWGWEEKNTQCEIIPVGINRLNKFDVVKEGIPGKRVLYCGYDVESFECGRSLDSSHYLEKHFQFIDNLSTEVRKTLTSRVFRKPYFFERYDKKYRDVKLQLVDEIPFYDAMKQVDLIVVDNYSSVHIEAIANNQPVIFFLANDVIIKDEVVYEKLKELHSYKVFAYSPEEAAFFVNDMEDVLAWWNNEELQKCVKEYLCLCAYGYDNIAGTWNSFLSSLD